MSPDPTDYPGYVLFFPPALLAGHPLAQHAHLYGFFNYAVAEALFLSEKEKQTIQILFQAIAVDLTTIQTSSARENCDRNWNCYLTTVTVFTTGSS